MKKVICLSVCALFILSCHHQKKTTTYTPPPDNTANDPVLMTIGDTKVHLSEFEYVYKKNNKDQSGDTNALNNYLDLFTVFKMKVKEAEDMKMDTTNAFKTELLGYRHQVAQQYLTDKNVTDSLLMEAYNRMHEDVRASHFLVRLDENALPRDTQIAMMKINIAQNFLNGKPVTRQISDYEAALKERNHITGASSPADTLKIYNLVTPLKNLDKKYHGKPVPFDDLAFMASEDETAKTNRGDLGYFTAFSMIYTFENVAYNTPVGKVGGPVRTRYGYHLVYVTDRRPAQGEVLVAHIMVKAPDGMPPQDSINAFKKASEIYDSLKAGKDFATMAKKYSDDKGTADKGGELQWFGLYKMPPTFEKAAFALQNKGDISQPIKTAWGWHIIKLIDKRGIPTFDEVKADIKAKVSRDQRAMQGRAALIAQVKKEYMFMDYPAVKADFYTLIDTSYFSDHWKADRANGHNKVMFTLAGQNYTEQDFAKWMEAHEVRRQKADVKTVVDQSYAQFVDETCVNYEDSRLEKKYPDFRNLMQEYRDGILLFNLMDQKVWGKAVRDTAGLRAFYDAHMNNYLWPERSDATVFSCKDAATAKKVHAMLAKGMDEKAILAQLNKKSQLDVQADHKLWMKKDNDMVDANWKQGDSPDQNKDGRVVFVHVYKIVPPSPKSLQDARGLVTSDYQNQLESEWVASLRKKYTVTVNRDVLKQVK